MAGPRHKDERDDDQSTPVDAFRFPGADANASDEPEWVELCVVPAGDEVARVAARLEAAMLPFSTPADPARPAEDGRVAVFVLAEDIDVAREALTRDADPGDDDDEDEEAQRQADEARSVSNWF